MIIFSLISVLPENTSTWLTYFHATVFYEVFANDLHPTKGWGQFPGRNDVKTADGFERVEIKTDDFIDSALVMIWVSLLKLLV